MHLQIFLRAKSCYTRFLTAMFLAARSGAFWLINNEIFGPVTIGILGDIFFSIFCYFIINAYFLVFCSYLLFRAYFFRAGSNLSGRCSLFLYRQAAFTAILTPI